MMGISNKELEILNTAKQIVLLHLDYTLENCEVTRYLTDQDYKSDVHWYNKVKEEVRKLK